MKVWIVIRYLPEEEWVGKKIFSCKRKAQKWIDENRKYFPIHLLAYKEMEIE